MYLSINSVQLQIFIDEQITYNIFFFLSFKKSKMYVINCVFKE